MTDLRQATQQALDALERALETSMRQALKARIPECGEFAGIAQDVDWAATALRTALEQQQAEPVAWNKSIRDSVDLLLEQAGYQPDSSARHQLAMMNFDAAQPQHKPLTVKEINALPEANGYCPIGMNDRILRLIRAAEAAHGIKEGT